MFSWFLQPTDTKSNIQSKVSLEELSYWLQRKKEGMVVNVITIITFVCSPLICKTSVLIVGEELPILLQQEPKSLAQGSATVLRGLLDPMLQGDKSTHSPPFPALSAIRDNPRSTEQSGAFLDNGQVLTLPFLDFPAGEKSATALWRLSERLIDGI